MNFQNEYIKKICSFYAGDYHLITMILPYLAKNIEKGVNINTILNTDLRECIDKLINNINIDKEIKNKIKKINWGNYNTQNIEQNVMNQLEPNTENILIINLQEDNEIKGKLINVIKKNKDFFIKNNIKLNLIYCYNIEKLKRIDSIISNYEYILNTSGIHEIKEVFQCDLDKEKIESKNAG